MKHLKIGIIGLGVGESLARTFSECPGCEVAALCDFSEEKLQKVHASHPQATITASADDLFRIPDLDVVAIASYDDAHASQAVRALEAGKHIFLEKPLCQNEADLRRIHNAWKRHGGKIQLGSNLVLRGAELYRQLHQKIQEGIFGSVYAWDGDYLYGRVHKLTEGWRGQIPFYSVIQGGGVHMIDLMMWLLNERPNRASCVGNRICTKDSAFRHPDFMAATFSFPSGAVGRVTANFGCMHRHHHVIRVFGTHATCIFDDAGARLHMTRDPDVSATLLPFASLPLSKGVLIPRFVQAIQTSEDMTSETMSFFDAMKVCFAADEAFQKGATVPISYL